MTVATSALISASKLYSTSPDAIDSVFNEAESLPCLDVSKRKQIQGYFRPFIQPGEMHSSAMHGTDQYKKQHIFIKVGKQVQSFFGASTTNGVPCVKTDGDDIIPVVTSEQLVPIEDLQSFLLKCKTEPTVANAKIPNADSSCQKIPEPVAQPSVQQTQLQPLTSLALTLPWSNFSSAGGIDIPILPPNNPLNSIPSPRPHLRNKPNKLPPKNVKMFTFQPQQLYSAASSLHFNG